MIKQRTHILLSHFDTLDYQSIFAEYEFILVSLRPCLFKTDLDRELALSFIALRTPSDGLILRTLCRAGTVTNSKSSMQTEAEVIQECEDGDAYGAANSVPEEHHELFLGFQ